MPVLKYIPADFIVRECLVVHAVPADDAMVRYVLLRKQGFTTSEAVGVIADLFGVARTDVTYGGLKDEDGITEQLVALPLSAAAADDPRIPWASAEGDRWIELHHHGFGAGPLQIGGLEGNGFQVVVRNLHPDHAEDLAAGRSDVLFLNYYDTQRFGVPGGPKRTHEVGGALLADDHDTALDVLRVLAAPESAAAIAWAGPARDFFATLDPRTVSFYLAAHASAAWNLSLRDLLSSADPTGTYSVGLDGLTYLYPVSNDVALRVLSLASSLPYDRYVYRDGEMIHRESQRPSVIQTRIRVTDREPDRITEGRASLRASFFLPSGCYATTALRQWMGYGAAPRSDTRPGL